MRTLTALCLIVSLALAGCATHPLTPAKLELPLAQTDVGIDAVYNVAVKQYLARAPAMDPVLKAKVKPVFQEAYRAVSAADAAEALGQADTVAAQIARASDLIRQAKSLAGIP